MWLQSKQAVSRSRETAFFESGNRNRNGYAEYAEASRGHSSREEKGEATEDISGQNKSVYKRLGELLRDSEQEESHSGIEPVALPQNPNVYLETLEEAGDESSKPTEAGSSSRLASRAGSCRWGYWWKTNMVTVKMGLTKEKLIRFGCSDLRGRISLCTSTIETAVHRTVHTVV